MRQNCNRVAPRLAAQIGRYVQARQFKRMRRSAIEPAIGHMKMDERLAHNSLKEAMGYAIHAVMCGAGHSLILALAVRYGFIAPDSS